MKHLRRVMQRKLVLLVATTLAITSCGADGSAQSARAADVYAVVIRTLAPERPGRPTSAIEQLDHVVFVGPFHEDVEISLEVQADVAGELEQFATIRFVDHKSEAIDNGDENEPVLENGVLVLLGSIPAGPSPSVKTLRYVDLDDVSRFRVTVERSNEKWNLVDAEKLTAR